MKTLKKLYLDHQGKVSDKWLLYLEEYDRLFSSYRDKEITLLEIGVQNGGSLELWCKYFPKAKKLIGCDINPECERLNYDDPRVSIVVGDANNPITKSKILNMSSEFDIIIDDGSHLSGDIVKSFAHYFDCLKNEGMYIAEDLHCSYWNEFNGGLYYPSSSIAFFKKLFDIVNIEHWGVDKNVNQFLRVFAQKYCVKFNNETLLKIHSIEIMNSLCAIRKKDDDNNVLGKRIISGSDEGIVDGHLGGQLPDLKFDQSTNAWSTLEISPEDQYENLKSELSARNEQLAMMLNSRSWRMTSPLRVAGGYGRKIRSKYWQIREAIKTYGLLAFFKKSFRV